MEEKLNQLAERFAELKGAKVLASRLIGSALSFVLSSGPKLLMNEQELRDAIAPLEPKPMKTKPVPESKEAGAVSQRKSKSDLATTKEN